MWSHSFVYCAQVVHDGESKNFTARALASSEQHVFASCRGRSYEYGVGTWDQITGQQVTFQYEGPGRPLGDACKLQWLPRTNLLLVANLFPNSDHSFISLLDSRTKGKVSTLFTYLDSIPCFDEY